MNNINIDEINKMFSEQKGFISNNNIKVEEVKENYAKLSSTIEEKSLNPYGIVHGGLLFGLADTAMGIAAKTTGKGSKIIAIAEALKVGKTISVYKCNIYDEKEELISSVTGTFYFIQNQ